MFCTQCGSKLAENSKFCPLCGTAAQPVTQSAAQQPVAAQPVYSAPVYPYPVYVMPAPAAQAAPQPAAPAAPAAAPAAPTKPYTAPVSATESVPAYRRPRPAAEETAAPAASAASAAPAADEDIEFVLEPTCEDMDTPLTVWQTILCLLALFFLPLGNIVFACVWGFRLNENPQRRTLARAALPFIAIGLIALFGTLLWLVLNMPTVSISFH